MTEVAEFTTFTKVWVGSWWRRSGLIDQRRTYSQDSPIRSAQLTRQVRTGMVVEDTYLLKREEKVSGFSL